MPYKKGTTPERLKNKGIPRNFIDQFISVFNSVHKKSGSEKEAYQRAYGVMNKALHKAGYRQGRDGKWTKSHEDMSTATVYEGYFGMRVVSEERSLEDDLREGMTFTGIAFIDNAVSQLGTGWERFYSPEFNDKCMGNSNNFMEAEGHTLTIYNKHGSAGMGFMLPSSKNPIGKVTAPLFREGDNIMYKGFISPTVEGKEVIRLLHDGVIGETSVRIVDVESSLHKLPSENDEEYGYIENMETGRLAGIDFCDQAGITGAGVVAIHSEGLSFETEYEDMEDEMDWADITIEELIENRKDLLDAHAASVLEAVPDRTEEIATLQKQLADAQEELAKAEDLQAVKRDLRIMELAADSASVSRRVATMLKDLGEEDDMDAKVADIRTEALAAVMSDKLGLTAPSGGEAKGMARTEEQNIAEEKGKPKKTEDEYANSGFSIEQREQILRYA